MVAKSDKVLLMYMLCVSLSLVLMAFISDSWSKILNGLIAIVNSPAQLILDYFEFGGIGAAFLNAGLVGLVCTALFYFSKAALSGGSIMAFFLTIGFSFFGINIANIWPIFLGVFIYTRVAKKAFKSQIHFAMFATSLVPFVSEAYTRYPLFDALPLKIALAVVVGAVAGFLLPILCGHGPNLHKGYSLYNAAMVSGFIGLLFFALGFRAVGLEAPTNTLLGDGYPIHVNVYFAALCISTFATGFLLNGRSWKGYKSLILHTGFQYDAVQSSGIGCALMNIGLFGLFVAVYYNAVGAAFTAPTLGSMLCLLAVTASGGNVLNVIPIFIGYAIASLFCVWGLNTQAIIVGICFASSMCPISGCFGVLAGIAAGMLHAILVTSVVGIHGGFCLYNGGFTSGLVAVICVPVLEFFFTPQGQYKVLPVIKKD